MFEGGKKGIVSYATIISKQILQIQTRKIPPFINLLLNKNTQ